ncbi:MAG: LPS export ABC transporter permease LptG [Deltaproteobacteria bacterium]|nr:LPS export ABC transporter permease LptG [Deltaproteobacteria bacterium]
MKTIHRYITRELLRNFLLCSMGFCFLFLMLDIFDRLDNLAQEDASMGLVLKYFLFKVPPYFNMTLPVAMLVSTMLTIGLLSKNSEITAMRASGLKISWIARPVLVIGLILSLFSMLLAETVVPYCVRREKEIYNIDIREKHKTGSYSQNDFWWRSGHEFYSVAMFDSRDDTLHGLSKLEIGPGFRINRRTDATRATWVKEGLGWTMFGVTQYLFPRNRQIEINKMKSLALPIAETPPDFYAAETPPASMSFMELRRFIARQIANGVSTAGYYSDLYAKISFPFVVFVSSLLVLPFSLRSARSGSMSVGFVAGIVIGFSYYAVHSFSLALGRAEMCPAWLAAWLANIIMLSIGVVLNLGAESPE